MPSKPRRFETQDQAINFLRSNCPEGLRERVQHLKQILVEKEEALEKLRTTELDSRAKFEATSATVAAKLLDWKYGDCSTGQISNFNPLRWRTARGGAIDFRTAVAEFGDLAQREPHRPVVLAIPPGLETHKQKFNSFSDAINFLKKDLDKVDQAQTASELSKQQLLSAQQQLHTAKTNLKEAEHAALAKGADTIRYQWKWGDTFNLWSEEQSPVSMIKDIESRLGRLLVSSGLLS